MRMSLSFSPSLSLSLLNRDIFVDVLLSLFYLSLNLHYRKRITKCLPNSNGSVQRHIVELSDRYCIDRCAIRCSPLFPRQTIPEQKQRPISRCWHRVSQQPSSFAISKNENRFFIFGGDNLPFRIQGPLRRCRNLHVRIVLCECFFVWCFCIFLCVF